MSQNNKPQDTIKAMFVQNAHGLTSSAGAITLQGMGHSTLFFADRPQRVVGHMSTRKFVDQWGEGINSFAIDPPNAVVSFLEDGDTTPEDVTVVLRDPLIEGIASRIRSISLTASSRPGRRRARCLLIQSADPCRRCPSRVCAVVSADACSDAHLRIRRPRFA